MTNDDIIPALWFIGKSSEEIIQWRQNSNYKTTKPPPLCGINFCFFFKLQVILVKCCLLNGSSDTSQTLLRLLVNGIRAPYSSFITFCTAIMDYRDARTAVAQAVQPEFLSLTESFWRDSSLCSEMTHAWSQLEVGAVELGYPGSR